MPVIEDISAGNPLGTTSRDASRDRVSYGAFPGSQGPRGVSDEAIVLNFPGVRPPDIGGSVKGKGKPQVNPAYNVQEGEIFAHSEQSVPTVRKYAARGRLSRGVNLFTEDVSVGKIGILGTQAADELEAKLFRLLSVGDLSLQDRSDKLREKFIRTLYLYLAINSGSVGNLTGRFGVTDDTDPLLFGDSAVGAVQVATVLGDHAYAYMRAKATEIRDTLEAMFIAVNAPDAEDTLPGLCRTADMVRVIAARRGLSQYPQYAAVGSEYATGTPPFLISLIAINSAKLLNGLTTNVRNTDVG